MRLHRLIGVLRPGQRRRGVSTVEFAFVAPVFFLMVLGVIEFGRGLMVQQLLLNAARNGVRKAIVGGQTSSSITTSITNELTGYNLNTTNLTVNVEVNDSTSPGLTTSTASGSEVTVQVLIPVGDVSWLPKLSFLKNKLAAQFTMRVE
jgi:Flp pilus assembly protein TadG